ncbi:MAG TPA: ATP-binding protein [Pirellulales bacterium]|nr:ATP-binding protein [Pirellulales bacterium]
MMNVERSPNDDARVAYPRALVNSTDDNTETRLPEGNDGRGSDAAMSDLIAAHDWSGHALGDAANWPTSLQTALRIMLGSRYAMWLGWGPELTFFYNDAYARMTLGVKHPWALGRPAHEVWSEIWSDIGPRAEHVLRTGQATWDERLLLFLNRRGFLEETYHTFSYSPVPDDAGGVGGLLCVVSEDTERTIAERRLRILRELAADTTPDANGAEQACQAAAAVLGANPLDVPFALIYLIDADARVARLAGAAGLTPGTTAAPHMIELTSAGNHGSESPQSWPLPAVMASGKSEIVGNLVARFGPLLPGPYTEPPHTAAVLPMKHSGEERLAGFLVAGVSPRRPFDDDYLSFLDHIAAQLATAVNDICAYEREIQRLSRELQRRLDEFGALLQVIPVGIAVADDPSCKHVWSNPTLTSMFQAPAGSNVSLSTATDERPGYKTFANGEELPPHELPLQKAIATGQEVCGSKHDVLLPDGTWMSVLNYAVPLYDEAGKVRGGLYVGVDVTEHEWMQKALRRAEERWRTMAETLPNLLWTSLPDGKCDWLSSQWGKYTGISEKELLGLRWLETVIHPDDRQRTLDGWNAACADRGEYDLEHRIRRYGGAYRWFKTRGVPIRDESGKIVYWFGSCTDIEDGKRAEQTLREADRRKDEFLAMLSHELRNPLAPVRCAAQTVWLLCGQDANLMRAAGMIERQVDHMVRLVDDLLDVSRITRGKITLHKERLDLVTVIAGAVEASRPWLDARKQELAVSLPHGPVEVEADSTRLAQVVSNLLNNAAKYTPERGHVWLSVEAAANEAIIRVRDDGGGMSADLLPKVFDLFVQGNRSLARSEGGLGIGLTLVRTLVEMHGGTITAASDGPGRGSEFVVRLPRLVEPPAAHVRLAGGNAAKATQSSRRVLVVDDNVDAADSMALLLRVQGHEVRTAYDGPTAVEAAIAFRPQVVLLDIGLPRMDGYEVARRLREQFPENGLALVAVTGYGQDEDRRRTSDAGFDAHLVKPADFAALSNLLEGL